MNKYAAGTVCFDNLLVFGREFVSSKHHIRTSYYDYSFGVAPYASKDKKSNKKAPLEYAYHWSGHINICSEDHRVHLHNIDDDVQLIKQEAKMALLKETIDTFVKELKDRGKVPSTVPLSVKHWLNPPDSRYTGYVAYHFDETGGASISIADCHQAAICWVYSYTDHETGLPIKTLDKPLVKHLEEICKGLDKAIKAIHNLRKFFEREVFEGVEK